MISESKTNIRRKVFVEVFVVSVTSQRADVQHCKSSHVLSKVALLK